MSESIELKNAASLVSRETYRATNTGSTMVVDDGTNRASIPGLPYQFEATGDKILVAVDIFRSGYECKDCRGIGRIISECPCKRTARPGYKYADAIPEEGRFEILCIECHGDPDSLDVNIECPLCRGKGHSIFIPDSSKTLPTTGVVVSIGAGVTDRLVKNGGRVLYGAYSGPMIPTKEPGIAFKFLREHEILGFIYNGEELGAFDFVVPEKVE